MLTGYIGRNAARRSVRRRRAARAPGRIFSAAGPVMEFAFAGACDYDTPAVSRTEICAFPRPPGAATLPGGRRTESA